MFSETREGGGSLSEKEAKALGGPSLQLRRQMPKLPADQSRGNRHQAVQLQS